MLASEKCYQLSIVLQSMSTQISYEDAQTAATDLVQCAANVLTVRWRSNSKRISSDDYLKAVNGPLQQRTNVLDLDYSRSNTLPDDYDTDLESEWSNLSEWIARWWDDHSLISKDLFADGNDFTYETIEKGRNAYYQRKLANQLTSQMNTILSSLTSSLNIHLNIGQDLAINTSNVFMSLESISTDTLVDRKIRQVGSAQISLPSKFNSTFNNNSMISLRVCSSRYRFLICLTLLPFSFSRLWNHWL